MIMNLFGHSSKFRNLANKTSHVSTELESICTDLNQDLGSMSEYWRGLSANAFSETLQIKINSLKNAISELEQLSKNISHHANQFEDRKEREIEVKKTAAFNRGDMIEYSRLCAKDFFDGEFGEE